VKILMMTEGVENGRLDEIEAREKARR